MNSNKTYVWQLAAFLSDHGMEMSGKELADHLNRNQFLTSYGTTYAGERGTYTLIRETWKWVNNDLGLTSESAKIAGAYVDKNGTHAWE